jgi:heme-degrading monooxygenase HmoA
MFVLHVDMKVKRDLQKALEDIFVGTFSPAITQQEGFRGVALLRPAESGDDYRLSIAFDEQALQQKWVATSIHEKVWGQMEGQCASYSVKCYNAV